MKHPFLHAALTVVPLLAASHFATAAPGLAQDGGDDHVTEKTGKSQAELEAEFERLLTGATLTGFTTIDGQEGLKADSYTLKRVSKGLEGRWVFEAQIEFGGKPIPIKMALPVVWAGDTPVISVTDMTFPFMGKYTARVLFYGDRYVGVWTGDGYGGEMFGRVKRTEEAGGGQGTGDGDGHGGEKQGAARGDGNWPSFRGHRALGVAEGHSVPAEFDVEAGKNVRWRVEVPGMAHSSPVIWGDRLFVSSAIRMDGEQELKVGLYGDIGSVEDESEFAFVLFCYDKKTGEERWSQVAWEGVPAVKRHPKSSFAASTPATDGKRVVAFYGSEGLYCWDMDGELLWKKDFGVLRSAFFMVPTAEWGFAGSPVLHEDKVVLQCDVIGESFVTVLDAKTGETIWRTERDEVGGWSSPTVDTTGGRAQVICNGYKHIGGYDLATGAELWKLVGGGDIPVPTPVVSDGLIYITNAHGRMAPIYAIATDAEGELSIDPEECEAMAWSHARRGNYMQTPVVHGGLGYFCNDAGVLTCYDSWTGEQLYRERLGEGRSGFSGSGVYADGRLYFTSEEGVVHVVKAGREFELLGRYPLGEEFMSTPAVSEGVIYFRARRHLVAVGE